MQSYPKLFIAVARSLQLCVDFDRIARNSDVQLREKRSMAARHTGLLLLTENTGGTDASLPVLFARVVTGMITSARGAGGWRADDAKNVASRVAIDE